MVFALRLLDSSVVNVFLQHHNEEETMNLFLRELSMQLKIRGLSDDTVECYTENVGYFLKYFKGRKASSLRIRDVHEYQLFLKETKKHAHSYVNQQVASIKFFLTHVLKKKWDFSEIPYLKEVRRLPVVLSKEEVWKLFHATSNLKHKTMLSTMYATGMRPHELCLMRYHDIRKDDMMVRVAHGKGGKERYVMLSKHIYTLLRRYWIEYPVEKRIWLFPADAGTRPMQVDTLSSIFRKCRKKARINGAASLYSIRHSFATHLLEDGCNLRVIQQLMGHASIESTIIYLHVAKMTIAKTISPFDSFFSDNQSK